LRAGREALRYEEGRSERLLDQFYNLMVLTRRRHRLVPQPRSWFLNLVSGIGEMLKIRVASKFGRPVAAILTLRHRDTLVYKYGCSDPSFSNLGGMQLVLWEAIQEAKREGLALFDFGRSDSDNSGLISFKDRWGAKRSEITYLRLLGARYSKGTYTAAGADWKARVVQRIFPHLPDRILCAAGDLIYRHIG
jgi:lipid II:glycine glycyltransferase (peptidoglycan interpeptide bridge formation enzyme)